MGWNQMWIKIWPRKKLYLMTGYSSVSLFFCLPHLLVCWWTKFFCYGFWTFLQKPGCFACSICCHSFHSLRAFFLFLTFLFPCFWFVCFARSICLHGCHSLLAFILKFSVSLFLIFLFRSLYMLAGFPFFTGDQQAFLPGNGRHVFSWQGIQIQAALLWTHLGAYCAKPLHRYIHKVFRISFLSATFFSRK